MSLNNLNLSSLAMAEGAPSVSLPDYIKGLSDLLVYYPMDDASGNIINRAPDTLGSHDGVATDITYGVAGQVGDAISLNGSSSKVQIPDADDLEGWAAYTMMFMFNKDSTDTKAIWDKNRFGPWDFHYVSTNTFKYEGGPGATNAGDDVGAGAWYNCIYTNTGSAQQLYVNGVASGSATAHSGGAGTSGDDVRIGAFHDDSAWFDGDFQHFAIWDRVLTATEIATIVAKTGL